MTPKRYKVIVCRGPECGERMGSTELHEAFLHGIRERGLEGRCELAWQSCFGRCRQARNVMVRGVLPTEGRFLLAVAPPPTAGLNAALYSGVETSDVPRILDEHVVAGRIVRELIKRPDLITEKILADADPSRRDEDPAKK